MAKQRIAGQDAAEPVEATEQCRPGKRKRPRCALPSNATLCRWSSSVTPTGAMGAASTCPRVEPSSLVNRRWSVDWQDVSPVEQPSVARSVALCRLAHSLIASTERWKEY